MRLMGQRHNKKWEPEPIYIFCGVHSKSVWLVLLLRVIKSKASGLVYGSGSPFPFPGLCEEPMGFS